jgi:hypothetical protein
MYGWRSFDDSSLVKDCPREPSLTLDLGPEAATHTFHGTLEIWLHEFVLAVDRLPSPTD